MELIKRFRWPIIGATVVALIVGFLLFRPDTLFIDDTVDESLQDAFATPETTTPPTTIEVTDAPVVSEPDSPETTASPEPDVPDQPAAPAVIGSGDFYGIDHAASGTATIYEQGGRFVLRFEDDTDIQNGPDLFVWVLAADDYAGGDPTGFLDLGKLKGNVGGQNYELPPEFDPAVNRSVLIWCKRFGVPFAASAIAST